MHVKEDVKKMKTSKDPRDASLSGTLHVKLPVFYIILKVLRPVDENSAEPRSIDRSCSASVLHVFPMEKFKKNIHIHHRHSLGRFSSRVRFLNVHVVKKLPNTPHEEDLREVSSSEYSS